MLEENAKGESFTSFSKGKELFKLVKPYSIFLLHVDFQKTDTTNSKLTISPFALVAHFVVFVLFIVCYW